MLTSLTNFLLNLPPMIEPKIDFFIFLILIKVSELYFMQEKLFARRLENLFDALLTSLVSLETVVRIVLFIILKTKVISYINPF